MEIKRTYRILSIALLIMLITVDSFSQQKAEKGVMDLKNYNFSEKGIIDIDGIWEFFPEKLYTPNDFSGISVINPKNVNVPSLWNENISDKKDNFNIGYGTYRLKVFLPKDVQILALRLKRIETSYVLWIDDDTLVSCGNPADNIESAIPTQKTLYKIFSVNRNSFDITLQISNFHHRKGGIDSPLSLGLPIQIINTTKVSRGFEMFIIGVLLIMAVFHFGLYIVKRKDYSLLFFGLLLISEMFSLIVNGEVMLTYYFPDISWFTLKKIDYISNFARSTFLILFFYKIYEDDISKIYTQIVTAINIVLTLIVLFTSLLFYSFTLFVFIGTASISILYILFVQIKGIFNKKEGALIPFIGTFLLLLSAVNDILYVSDIIETMFLTPFGIFIFIFSQSYLLSFNFSNLYRKTEELNKMTSELDEFKNLLLEKRSFKYIDSLKILTEFAYGTRGILFSVSNNNAIFKSQYPNLKGNDINNEYPFDLINDVIFKKEPVIISQQNIGDVYDKNYISEFKLKSSVCIPLMVADEVRSILYLENNQRKNIFHKQKIEVFNYISDQIIGLIDNIEMYQELEDLSSNLGKIIKDRTQDIRSQNELLLEQKYEIEALNNELNNTLAEVSKKNNLIKDSIIYAKYLQDANLPKEEDINKIFKDSFILYKPKEIISGDFYWINNSRKKSVFVVADCTGHGVPGALISVIGYDMLNNVIINKELDKPAEILNSLQEEIVIRLAKGKEEEIKDGMEMAIISYDEETQTLEYAGAGIDLIIYRNGKMTEVKSNRLTISAFQHERLKGKKFSNHKIQIEKDDIVYLYTDGFQDQFGGKNDTKFMKKNFRALLEEVNQKAFSIQRSHLLKTLNHWQGKNPQTDDILVAGIKF